MDDRLESPTKLTEFAPLASEEKEQSVGQFISKIFKFGKSYITNEPTNSGSDCSVVNDNVSQNSLSSWTHVESDPSTANPKIDVGPSYQYTVDVSEGRNLPNVLKRISNLLALKSTGLKTYGETELKQYWMRDSVSRECYECCEKFTTFRRRHHCRICGQIFCSQCCNQRIPGKILGCTGDLRACTYCCKIVLSSLQAPDVEAQLTADLRAFQEDLQLKFGNVPNTPTALQQSTTSHSSSRSSSSDTGSLRRRISIGYQEEKYAPKRPSNFNYVSAEERIKILQNSVSLRNLYEELCRPTSGLILQTHRYRLRSYSKCFLGSEIIDWLIAQHKASTRIQAAAICQALLEAGYLKCLTEHTNFCDGYALYQPQLAPCSQNVQAEEKFDTRNQDEPSWMQQIPPCESSTTDSEADFPSPVTEKTCRLPSSSSSFLLDLNLEESTVHLMRPSSSDQLFSRSESDISQIPVEINIIQPSQHREHVPASGWHNATDLRTDNGEQLAYDLLTDAYIQHERSLINQLLSTNGLSLNWREVITPLVHEIVDKIQPDKTHDAEDLDIRNHVQFKKIPGGLRQECKLIEGIVCTKNVAHRGMATHLDNPRILFLNCSLVYQRTEGRLMSLEPVILQEHEYLKNVASRIIDLQPNLVLVQRNVSRLAQDLLRANNVTLVLNVKLSVLERLAKCCKADLVTAVDAHIGRSKLGTCKKFYLKTFTNNKTGMQKTLMFFEGLPHPHLGGTALLRGGSKAELIKLKQTIRTILFASYNWRLEKSFLMDEFAQPPNPKADKFFDDGSSKESSPDFTASCDIRDKNILANIAEQKENMNERENTKELLKENNETIEQITKKKEDTSSRTNEEKKIQAKSIKDFSDPLQSYLNDDSVIEETNTSIQHLSVAELPFSNKFRKALDETILSTSPYLQFFIPYLETDIGRKCKLRDFFPSDIYFSKQFLPQSESKASKRDSLRDVKSKIPDENLVPLHPFISMRLTTKVSEDIEAQSMLAHFRACGGRYTHRQLQCTDNQEKEKLQLDNKNAVNLDVFDVNNHQKIAVLFCSFSHNSNNAPAFCVNPWVVNMFFYGQDDIPLGCFLERYCFRSTYVCQSLTCDTPMLHHVRRFVHNSGCVSISLNTYDNKSKDENIVMWSGCCKCSAVSPVVPMSADTWSFSFAKYLELRFYTNIYTRRGTEACSHSLHYDHHQYFGYRNIVAIFKYTTIQQWEISLPPPLIEIQYDTISAQQTEVIDEIKSLALRGHEVFSNILERLSVLPSDGDGVSMLKQQLQKEHNLLKGKVEEVQLRLTSPTLENKKNCDFTFEDVQDLIWPLEDLTVQLKKIIADAVETWNNRLVGTRKRDSYKKDKIQAAHVLEDTDLSENEGAESKTNESTIESSMTSEGSGSTILHSKKIRSLDHPEFLDENAQSINLHKGHSRSQSDGTVMAQSEESFDSKKTMKAILAQLLSSSQGISLIQCPFGQQEHHLLPPTVSVSIVVYENELSSIIAYALDSYEYKKSLDESMKKLSTSDPTPSPIHKRKTLMASDRTNSSELISSVNERPSGLLSFLWTGQKDIPNSNMLSGSDCSENEDPLPPKDKVDDTKKSKPPYIEVEFQDLHCNFYCRIYYAERFLWLRRYVIPAGDEAYIRSLCRSVQWNARGGKSGSSFCKTKDDRFILKEMTKQELQQFLDSGNNYFTYMEKCISSKLPTLLGKIVGVYQIIFRNATTNANIRINLLVMENLFYNRTVSHKFDLKGSMRNRLVNPDDQDGEIVLLDENLLKRTCESPLYIYPHSKEVLTAAIQRDTEFLSSQRVMDYSLLVGLDEDTQELVVGIIDYIRTFTWDKKLETMVKKAGILGGQGRLPTIISPEEYRDRFIAAMHRYFLQVPDRWTGLGKGLDFS